MGRHKLIGVPVDLRWTFKRHHEVLAGIRRYANQRPDWELIVDPPVDWFTGSSRHSLAGVVGRLPDRIAAAARRTGMPAVDTTFRASSPGIIYVRTDLSELGRTVARHLLEIGYRQFAFCGNPNSKAHLLLLGAFKQILDEAGATVQICMSKEVEQYGTIGKRSRFSRWLKTLKPPVALYCTFDHIARLIANELLRRGWRIPEDAAVLGTGNEDLVCEAMEPTLSSADLNSDEVGYRAAAALDALLSKRKVESELVPALGVITRRSTDIRIVPDVAVAAVLAAIHRDFRKPVGLPELLAEAGASRRTVLRRFVNIVGRTIHQELTRRRLDEAKSLLLRTSWSLNAIARQSGFRDDKHLCRVFAMKITMSPSQWRSNYRTDRGLMKSTAAHG